MECNTLAFVEPPVPLSRHLAATAAAALLLYRRDWVVAAGQALAALRERGVRVDDTVAQGVIDALPLAALLHDAGKAAPRYRGSKSYMCHEVISAAVAFAAAGTLGRHRLPLTLAAVASLLHHHAMTGRLDQCGRLKDLCHGLDALPECLCRALSEALEALRRLDDRSVREAAERLEWLPGGIRGLTAQRVERECSSIQYALKRSNAMELLTRRLMEALGARQSGLYAADVAARLAVILTGFTSVADSIAVLLDGRVDIDGDTQSLAEDLAKRYVFRVLAEKEGTPVRLTAAALKLGAISATLRSRDHH